MWFGDFFYSRQCKRWVDQSNGHPVPLLVEPGDVLGGVDLEVVSITSSLDFFPAAGADGNVFTGGATHHLNHLMAIDGVTKNKCFP